MKQKYQLIYDAMMARINAIEELPVDSLKKAEQCYWAAYYGWDKLKQVIDELGFACDEEEINFFRVLKPRFCSEMEYYVILTEALPFEPENKQKAIDFWTEEHRRLGRFVRRHVEFLKYYKSGKSDQDANYFIRKNNVINLQLAIPLSDNEAVYHTTHDRIIRSYLARMKYGVFVTKRVLELRQAIARC